MGKKTETETTATGSSPRYTLKEAVQHPGHTFPAGTELVPEEGNPGVLIATEGEQSIRFRLDSEEDMASIETEG